MLTFLKISGKCSRIESEQISYVGVKINIPTETTHMIRTRRSDVLHMRHEQETFVCCV
jgi:hypothetical protein